VRHRQERKQKEEATVTELLKRVAGLDNVTDDMVTTALTMLDPLLGWDDLVATANIERLREMRYQGFSDDDSKRLEDAKQMKGADVMIDKFKIQIVRNDMERLRSEGDKSDSRAYWINDKVTPILEYMSKT
jgi:hypothetical protein